MKDQTAGAEFLSETGPDRPILLPIGRDQQGRRKPDFFMHPTRRARTEWMCLTPNPLQAPFAELSLLEMMRHLYLTKASGVLNAELSDIVTLNGQGTIFEQAQTAS